MYIARKIQENVSTGRMIVALEQVTSPTNTSKISQDHGNSRWRSSLPRTLPLADSPTSICRLPSVVFPVISLLTDKPKCSSEVSSVEQRFQVYQGENIPRSLEEEIETIFLISRIIRYRARYYFLFFYPFPSSFVFPSTIERAARVETLVEWKTKFSNRGTKNDLPAIVSRNV